MLSRRRLSCLPRRCPWPEAVAHPGLRCRLRRHAGAEKKTRGHVYATGFLCDVPGRLDSRSHVVVASDRSRSLAHRGPSTPTATRFAARLAQCSSRGAHREHARARASSARADAGGCAIPPESGQRGIVVSVVVRVRMFVLRRMVTVFVPMRLHQVQQHAAQHQNTSRSHAPAQRRRMRRHGTGRSASVGGRARRPAPAAVAARTSTKLLGCSPHPRGAP